MIVRSTVLLLATVVTAAPLSAQVRLPKPKLPGTSASASTAPRQPRFDDRVVEMTDARLNALLRGLSAEQGKVQQLTALERQQQDEAAADAVQERKERDAREQRQEQNSAARQKVEACYQASPEYRAATGPAAQARQKAATDRAKKAAEQGKYDEVTRISDSLATATEAQEVVMRGVARRCGATDEMLEQADEDNGPPPPLEPEVEEIDVRDSLMTIGATTSGMTEEQYAVMRERVLAYLNTSSEDLAQSAYVFGANELRALQGKRTALARFQELMTEY